MKSRWSSASFLASVRAPPIYPALASAGLPELLAHRNLREQQRVGMRMHMYVSVHLL